MNVLLTDLRERRARTIAETSPPVASIFRSTYTGKKTARPGRPNETLLDRLGSQGVNLLGWEFGRQNLLTERPLRPRYPPAHAVPRNVARQKDYRRRTPVMAAKLADHISTWDESLSVPALQQK